VAGDVRRGSGAVKDWAGGSGACYRPLPRSIRPAAAALVRLFRGDLPATVRRGFSCDGADSRSADPRQYRPTQSMRALLDVVLLVLQLYVWLLIAAAILSWLIAFNVVNTGNQLVGTVADFLYRITEPVLRPIRSLLPNLGGIDVSPVILILIIFFIQSVIVRYIYPNVF